MSELEEQLIETTKAWSQAFRERGRHSFYHGLFFVQEASSPIYTSMEFRHSERVLSMANLQGEPSSCLQAAIGASARLLKNVYLGFLTGEMNVHLREDDLQIHLNIGYNGHSFQGNLGELQSLHLPKPVEQEKELLLHQYRELLKTYSDTT